MVTGGPAMRAGRLRRPPRGHAPPLRAGCFSPRFCERQGPNSRRGQLHLRTAPPHVARTPATRWRGSTSSLGHVNGATPRWPCGVVALLFVMPSVSAQGTQRVGMPEASLTDAVVTHRLPTGIRAKWPMRRQGDHESKRCHGSCFALCNASATRLRHRDAGHCPPTCRAHAACLRRRRPRGRDPPTSVVRCSRKRISSTCQGMAADDNMRTKSGDPRALCTDPSPQVALESDMLADIRHANGSHKRAPKPFAPHLVIQGGMRVYVASCGIRSPLGLAENDTRSTRREPKQPAHRDRAGSKKHAECRCRRSGRHIHGEVHGLPLGPGEAYSRKAQQPGLRLRPSSFCQRHALSVGF